MSPDFTDLCDVCFPRLRAERRRRSWSGKGLRGTSALTSRKASQQRQNNLSVSLHGFLCTRKARNVPTPTST